MEYTPACGAKQGRVGSGDASLDTCRLMGAARCPVPLRPNCGRRRAGYVHPPRPQDYTFDPTRMLGIQFHVPTNTMSRTPYAFCIRNLTLLRE